MNTKISLAVAGALSLMSATASAELYVYPVKSSVVTKEDVTSLPNQAYHSNADSTYATDGRRYDSGPSQGAYGSETHPIYRGDRSSSKYRDMTMNTTRTMATASLPCYGRDVPVDIAISNIMGSDFKINVQDSVKDMRLSWSGDEECQTPADIIDLINHSNSIWVTINETDKVVGIADTKETSKYFSYVNPQVWISDPTQSITENMTGWAESIGWKVEWPKYISKYDFEAASTTLYGPLIGEGALFHQVLKQIAERYPDVVLSVTFYPNKYIVVTDGGYSNE